MVWSRQSEAHSGVEEQRTAMRERPDEEGRRRLEELAEGHLHGCGHGGRSGRWQ